VGRGPAPAGAVERPGRSGSAAEEQRVVGAPAQADPAPVLALALSVLLTLLTAWAAVASSYETNWPVGFFVGAHGAAWFLGGRLWAEVAVAVPRGGHAPVVAVPGRFVR
jgi:hypothetical protein